MKILAAVLLASAADQDALSIREYRDRTEGVRAALQSGDLAKAQRESRELASRRVRHEGREFAADAPLFRAVAEASDVGSARGFASRLRALVDAIDALGPAVGAEKPDVARLERLRQEQSREDLSKGGQVGGPRLHSPNVPRSLSDRLLELGNWIGDKLGAFFKWLWELLFGERHRAGGGGGASFLTTVLVVVLVAGLGFVAWLAWRRRAAAAPGSVALSEAPEAGARDEDPLSRPANEWERFAAELLAAGRFREAIRAWYHALLMTLFRGGLLVYRKDRTNWEYAYALSPSAAWRPSFLEATRRFEFEWYGRRNTGAETADEFSRGAQSILAALRREAVR
jgi:hypothetical protein